MELKNCPECGKVFTFIRTNLCPACQKKDEDDFRAVRSYIIKNSGAGIPEISEETGISEEKIMRYIREGRISTGFSRTPVNIQCEVCGRTIPNGRLCQECTEKLSSGLKKSILDENKRLQQEMEKGPRMHTADMLKREG